MSFVLALVLSGLIASGTELYAKPTNTANRRSAAIYLASAQKDFNEGKYGDASSNYRKYLRRNRKDADAWSQLAVCMYYSGEPDRALDYLKRWENRSRIKSYNQYHQGLILSATNREKDARAPLIRAARSVDDYAARSIYELIALEYNDNDYVKATYWINLYRQRFPQGPLMPQIMRIEASINNRMPLTDVEGNKKPDIEQALYKFHPYSLTSVPHYWFAHIGYIYGAGDTVQPNNKTEGGTSKTKVQSVSTHDLLIHTGIGLGPVRQNDLTSYFGYNYRQDWWSDDDRLRSYVEVEDFSDLFLYLPFRADLLERTHRLYADLNYDLPLGMMTGALVYQEFSFMGSSLIPGPEGDEIDQKSRYTGETSQLQPYFGYRYKDLYEGRAYLYMYKKVLEDAKEFSHKTYNLLGDGDPVMSYGLSNRINIPQYRMGINVDLFQFEYIYNNYWEDFTRLGGLLGIDAEFDYGIYAEAGFGYYSDQYQLKILRQGDCNYRTTESESATSNVEPRECQHVDTGLMYHVGLGYEFNQFYRLKFDFTMVENQNPNLIVYERTDMTFKLGLTMAFPSYKKVYRFMERYGDYAFTKKVE